MKRLNFCATQLAQLDIIIKTINLEYLNARLKDITLEVNENELIKTYTLSFYKYDLECCPVCGSIAVKVYSSYTKTLNHFIDPIYNCKLKMNLRKYVCNDCGYHYSEPSPVYYYRTYTREMILLIIYYLSLSGCTMTGAANYHNISPATVRNIVDDCIVHVRADLPEIIGIDEIFFSRSAENKFIFVIADFKTGSVVDILPNRKKETIRNYFKQFSLEERLKVKYVTQDMSYIYKSVIEEFFPNAKIAVDSFHIHKVFNSIINDELVSLAREYKKDYIREKRYTSLKYWHYYMLKRYGFILKTNSFNTYKRYKVKGLFPTGETYGYKYCTWSDIELVNYLLSIKETHLYDSKLRKLYDIKEKFVSFNHTDFQALARKELFEEISVRSINDNLIYKRMYKLASNRLDDLTNELILSGGYFELIQLGHTLLNWHNEIVNSFIKVNRGKYSGESNYVNSYVRLNNGITERLNRRIANVIRSNMRFTNKERAIKIIILKINKQDIINQILKHDNKIVIK